MELGIVGEFIQYGIFAGLFVALFVYTLKKGGEREAELRATLDKFADVCADKLANLCDEVKGVKTDVEDIKDKLND